MTIRGVKIRMDREDPRRSAPEKKNARRTAAGKNARTTAAGLSAQFPLDERSVRAACAKVLSDAHERKLTTVSVSVPRPETCGISPVALGKIMAQEAIRMARAGRTTLRRITFRHANGPAGDVFENALQGYISHFLDWLIWGPLVTVDAVIEVAGGIVLVRRSNPPFGYALPGGFVDYGESLETAVRREAMEETGLQLLDLRQHHTYSDPSRDPRFHTITTVFAARAEGQPRAGDDAASVLVADRDGIVSLQFAFDHRQVLEDYLAGGFKRS